MRETITENYERFSRVADNYARYRPRYSAELIPFLSSACGLKPDHKVADIGCGTGLLAESFLENGNIVYGVEPNDNMRAWAEKRLGSNPLFNSIVGTAEDTTLESGSVNFVTAGQAFHWFNHVPAKEEFRRILVPDGWLVLAWNWVNYSHATEFLTVFKHFWQKYLDPRPIPEKPKRPEYIDRFFGEGNLQEEFLNNYQENDWETLRGWILSASTSPKPDDSQYPYLLADLEDLFGRYQENGLVTITYRTIVVYGRLV